VVVGVDELGLEVPFDVLAAKGSVSERKRKEEGRETYLV
jgi:hypothetical protein